MNKLTLSLFISFVAVSTVQSEQILPGSEMMSTWLKQQAIEAIDRRDAEFENLETIEDLQNWQQTRQKFFVSQLGGFPNRSPLNATITGKLQFEDYRIEKLYFASQPGFYVTATLYLPIGKGPFPAVLHPTGHSASAKNRDLYQEASITIARGGCAVLCYDPIGQGERKQIKHPETGKQLPSTIQHTFINQGLHLLGSNTAQIMVWDGMRAVDYLQSRPDILPNKIGCTGISGGGTNTSYLMALDDRIVAAAPGCYLTGFRSLLNTIGPQDAEQNIHGQIAFGMDHSDYVLMHLPKPTLIMAATRDYFDIKGAWNLFREGKRFATTLGVPERIDLTEPNTEHGFPPEMQLAAANWMRRWLLDIDKPVSETGVGQALPEEELNATPTGSVLDLKGAKSVFEITAEWNQSFAYQRQNNALPENRSELLQKIRQLIVARDLNDLPDPKVKKVKSGFVIESEPGIFLPAQLEGEGPLTIVVGKHTAGAENFTGFYVDLRGTGKTAKSTKSRAGSLASYFGEDWRETTIASLLGKTYVGMRTEDIWQSVLALRKILRNDTLKPNLLAFGEAAVPALHAAALEPDLFGEISISTEIDTWTDIVHTPLSMNQQSSLVFGALREYDLPMLRDIINQ